MTADRIPTGSVIRYSYLWLREKDKGEDSGRKDRPVCVQLVVARNGISTALLFPITSQLPAGTTLTLAIPQVEARRVGLVPPSWIVINESNEDDLAISPFIADTVPLGTFSKAFRITILKAVIEIIKTGQHKRVERR